jgi:hypothetical protein
LFRFKTGIWTYWIKKSTVCSRLFPTKTRARRAQDARARSAVTSPGWRWIVEAHREGRRYMVHSDELLSAFWSWVLCCGSAEGQEDPIVSDHRYNFIHSNAEYAHNR